MALCVLCAQPTLGDQDVCAFHVASLGDDWATGNRIMCDFLHRGIVHPLAGEPATDVEVLVGALDEAVP